MARSLLSIRTDSRSLFGQTDSANSNVSDTTLNVWVNECIRRIAIALKTGNITEQTYTTANEVTLDSNTISVDVIKFLVNDGTTTRWRELEPINMRELAEVDADWENAAASEPRFAYKKDHFTMGMYPPLDTNNISQANGLKTYGLELPAELSGDSDTTPFAHHLDDIISHWVAYRAWARLGEADRSVQELIQFRGMLKEAKAAAVEWSRGRKKWSWGASSYHDGGRWQLDQR